MRLIFAILSVFALCTPACAQEYKDCKPRLSIDGTISIATVTLGDRDKCPDPVVDEITDYYLGVSCQRGGDNEMLCLSVEPAGIIPVDNVLECNNFADIKLEDVFTSASIEVKLWGMKSECTPTPIGNMIVRRITASDETLLAGKSPQLCYDPYVTCIGLYELKVEGGKNLSILLTRAGLRGAKDIFRAEPDNGG